MGKKFSRPVVSVGRREAVRDRAFMLTVELVSKLKTLTEKIPDGIELTAKDIPSMDVPMLKDVKFLLFRADKIELIKEELRLLLGSLSCEETLQGKKTEEKKWNLLCLKETDHEQKQNSGLKDIKIPLNGFWRKNKTLRLRMFD